MASQPDEAPMHIVFSPTPKRSGPRQREHINRMMSFFMGILYLIGKKPMKFNHEPRRASARNHTNRKVNFMEGGAGAACTL
jgi:hypothetical protein